MKILSAGEIEKGMYVVCYEHTAKEARLNPMTGEISEVDKVVTNPWFKGVPYRVTQKAGPIVAIDTLGIQNIPRVCFMDTRFAKFFEVEKEYHDDYYALMGVDRSKLNQLIKPTVKAEVIPVLPAFENKTFSFHKIN